VLLTGRETAKTQIFLLPQIFHHEYKIFITRNPGYPDHFIMFSLVMSNLRSFHNGTFRFPSFVPINSEHFDIFSVYPNRITSFRFANELFFLENQMFFLINKF
jgi:hypothetical protein